MLRWQYECKGKISCCSFCNIRDNDTSRKSSSSGVAYLIAYYVVAREVIVFGAKFNENWEAIHGYCGRMEGAPHFMGSKYVPSKIENL